MPLPATNESTGRMRQPLTNRRSCPSPIKRALCRCESRELGWKLGFRMFADNSGNASLVTPKETGLGSSRNKLRNSVNDDFLLFFRHLRKHRQRQDLPAGFLGFRKCAGAITQTGKGRLQMKGKRIVDLGGYAAIAQMFTQLVALRCANHELVVSGVHSGVSRPIVPRSSIGPGVGGAFGFSAARTGKARAIANAKKQTAGSFPICIRLLEGGS